MAESARSFLARADADRKGPLKAVVIFIVCAAVSAILWYPLGLPSEIVRNVIARPTLICSGGFEAFAYAGTPRMYLCSTVVAVLTMAGPIALMIVAFIYRKTLLRSVRLARSRVPAEAEFLVAPIAATLIFGLAWAGSHFQTGWRIGFMPQIFFPGVIGLFTYAVARWGGDVQRRLAPFFDRRDRYSLRARAIAAVAVPFVISILITNESRVTATAIKEQLVVLLGLVSGFVALAPRSGDVVAGVTREMSGIAQRAAALRKRPS